MTPREVIREYSRPEDGIRIPISVIHPLLEMRKSDIYAYMNEQYGCKHDDASSSSTTPTPTPTTPTISGWNEDTSNQEPTYTRNKIRLDLIPMIQQVFGNEVSLYE